jgi:hypothetical protein
LSKPRDIRAFRSAIAKLKKAGVISPVIDARGAVPGPVLNKALRKFKDIISGQATALPLKRLRETAAELRAKNYQIARPALGKGPRVIVQHFKGHKVTVKKGAIERTDLQNMSRIELPAYRTGETLPQYFARLKRMKLFPDLKAGEQFGGRFFDGRTRMYSSPQDLINKVQSYESVRRAKNMRDSMEIIRNFEIVVVHDRPAWSAARKEAINRRRRRGDKRV